MKRGIKIHQQLCGESKKEIQPKKGRNGNLKAERNNDLFHRYYYYSKIHRMKYDDILSVLGLEFRLAEITITRLIINSTGEIKEIFKNAYSVYDLGQMFPLFSWKENNKKVEIKEPKRFILK